jgi:hypothetical protein
MPRWIQKRTFVLFLEYLEHNAIEPSLPFSELKDLLWLANHVHADTLVTIIVDYQIFPSLTTESAILILKDHMARKIGRKGIWDKIFGVCIDKVVASLFKVLT